jgi:hypothetical protein
MQDNAFCRQTAKRLALRGYDREIAEAEEKMNQAEAEARKQYERIQRAERMYGEANEARIKIALRVDSLRRARDEMSAWEV